MVWLLWGNPERRSQQENYIYTHQKLLWMKISTETRPNRNEIAKWQMVMVTRMDVASHFVYHFVFILFYFVLLDFSVFSWMCVCVCGAIAFRRRDGKLSLIAIIFSQYSVILFLDFIFKNSIFNVIVVILDFSYIVFVVSISVLRYKKNKTLKFFALARTIYDTVP